MDYQSSEVFVGNIALGGKNPVRVQSMTTTNTLDTYATIEQVKQLVKEGCELVRITTQNIKEANNLSTIKNELLLVGIDVPLIADVHYNPKVAEVAAQYADKVRINPGNYIDIDDESASESVIFKNIKQNLVPLLNICKQHNTAIRIGTNHGSLSKRILFKYGNTALGMVESIMEFVEVCNKLDFNNLILSLKASNVTTMIESNLLLVERLIQNGLNYPLHLGVTEAGSDEDGRVKSAAGIGYLLAHGIGDTIRVSLTEDPVNEIPVANKLVENFGKKEKQLSIDPELYNIQKQLVSEKPPLVFNPESSIIITDPSHEFRITKNQKHDNKNNYIIAKFNYPGISYDDLIIKATVEISVMLLNNSFDGIWIDNSGKSSDDDLIDLALNILQVLGLRISKTEFIACPTCGRSTIDVIKQLDTVKKQASHLPGLKIAVMGCSVNGPGEMADADYGCVGSGVGKVNIYKGGKIIIKNVPQDEVSRMLIELINQNSM